jgi:hypothetical protein
MVRNVLLAGTNGAITLVILLIAPLGLAAVIINTLLVTAATFITGYVSDWVIVFLQRDRRTKIQVVAPSSDDIERRP